MAQILVNGKDIKTFLIRGVGSNPAVENACQILRSYLQTSSIDQGRTIVVGIAEDLPEYVSQSDLPAIEGIFLSVNNETVVVSGGSGRAVLYAVYEFLERFCGWRFYTPTLETAPGANVVLSDTIYRFDPPFSYRMNLLPSAGDGTPHFQKRHLNARWGTQPDPESVGGSITFANTNCHTFRELLPDSVYFDEHPEYFAVNEKGERVKDERCGTQPCLSHPTVFDIVLEGVKKALREHPEARYVSVSQNDGNEFCHCEACKKVNEEEGTDGGTIFRFVNRIAEAIEKDYPHVLVDTIPYNYSTKPPVKTVMRDNVSIRLCLMACCREHTISDESCPYNEKVRSWLSGWSKATKHLEIWDYNANFFNYPMSVFNFKLLYQNIKTLRRYPVCGIMFLGAHTTKPDIEFSELWGYLQAKLAWDPDMSYSEYVQSTKGFLQAYYGEGWTYIYDYLLLMMTQPSSDYHYGPGATCEQIIPMLHLPDGSPDLSFIKASNALFDLAEKASSGEALERVRRSRLHLTWYELCTTYTYIRKNGTPEQIETLREKYETFFNTVNKWESFRFCQGKSVYQEPFDFEKHPYSYTNNQHW